MRQHQWSLSTTDGSSSAEDSDDDANGPREILGSDEVHYGKYVLYQWDGTSYYVGTVDDISFDPINLHHFDEEVQCSG